MATWPSGNKAVTTTTDADSDSISGARVDINKTVSNLNDVIDMFDMSTLADDRILVYDAASATFKVEDQGTFTGDLAGNPLYDSTGDVTVEDRMVVKPNSTDDRNITLGDESFGGASFLLTNLKIDGKEERWPWITLDEFSDGPFPKTIGPGNFTNPLIISRVSGGTPSTPKGLLSGRRVLAIQATIAKDDDSAGTNYDLPTSANFRFQAETTENQRNSGFGGRGTKVFFDTTANGDQSAATTLSMQGDTVTITPSGDGTLDCGGTLTIHTTDNVVRVDNQKIAWGAITGTGATVIDGDNSRIYADGAGGIILGGATQTGEIDIASQLRLSSQSTGTPSNTTTPTGYIEIIINGTTRYMPYYT